MIRPIAVGGTGESYPGDERTDMPEGTMLKFVTDKLDPEIYLPGRWVGYPAAYGNPMSYEESVQVGMEAVDANVFAATEADEQVVLLGYSQGAAIVRRWAASIVGDQLDEKLLGVACVADPYRPVGNALGHDPGGYGIAGVTKVWEPGFLLEVAADRDPICAAQHNSYLRTVADLTGFMSTDPRDLQKWMQSIIATIRDRGWQNANLDWGQFWLTGQRVNEAIDMAGGYLPRIERRNILPWLPPIVINPGGGRHTCYWEEIMPNSQYTYCEMMALELNRLGAMAEAA